MPKIKRKNTFTIDASSVQNIEGATITFKVLKRKEWKAWRDDPETDDDDIILSHVVSWHAIIDENGNELPSPKDEPGSIGELFFHEVPMIANLLLQGPDGPDALKN